jgi:pimeloyl-ACP methyl ester carboxylesterase
VRDAPLLVLHGLLGSAINWRTTAPKLTHRRRVVSVDVRNHGGSPHVAAMDFASCAADVIALMDSKGIDRAVILGHSLGGKIAMASALLYPQRITACISVDMAPIQYMVASAGWSGVGRIVAACAAVPLKDMRSRAQVDAFLKPLIPDFTTRAFVMQNIVVTAHEPTAEEIAAGADAAHKIQTVSWRCNLEVLAASLPRMAEFDLGLPGGATPARFEGPSLFVAGGRSTYLLPAHEAAIEALFHHHQMVSIPDAGHWVHVERPKEFVEIVQPWLQKLEQLEEPTQPRVA